MRVLISVAAAQRDGFCPKCIRKCLNGYRKTHRGHLWRYAADPLKDRELDLTCNPTEVAETLNAPVDTVRNRMKYVRATTGVTEEDKPTTVTDDLFDPSKPLFG